MGVDTKGNITMNIEQRKEYVWQEVERFINENYGLEATRVGFRGIPEGATRGGIPPLQTNLQQYALIFDVPGMVRKILYFPRDPMEDRMTETQFKTWANDHLSSSLPSILGL